MIYIIDITSEMLKQPNLTPWALAKDLPAGKYLISGSGRYGIQGGKMWAYNEGSYTVRMDSIMIGEPDAWKAAPAIFQGKPEMVLDIMEGGQVLVKLNDSWGRYAQYISEALQYVLFPAGEVIEQPPLPPSPPPAFELAPCDFPALQWNLIQVLKDLIAWIGCMLKNVIKLLQYITDWLLHFPDHLDAWVSHLFGIDPALPFFPELMRKIDVYVSARLGVDPEKPLLDEIAKKLLEWFFTLLDSKADQAPRKWR